MGMSLQTHAVGWGVDAKDGETLPSQPFLTSAPSGFMPSPNPRRRTGGPSAGGS
jgi:hypothetical protein